MQKATDPKTKKYLFTTYVFTRFGNSSKELDTETK